MTDPRAYDIRFAAYALITDGARVLLVRLREPTPSGLRWTLPGGGVELHETPEQALHREMLEETGHTVRLGALLGIDTFVTDGAQRLHPPHVPLQSVRAIYRATITGGELRDEPDGSTDLAGWVPLGEVDTLGCLSLVHAALRFAGD
ncbi:MAG: NUDIX domain-containing protein [Thermoleophilia bacterium]